MSVFQTSEAVKRLQKLLETLEEKKTELDRAYSDYQRAEIAWKKCEKDLKQVRRQVSVELGKLDPDLSKVEDPVLA